MAKKTIVEMITEVQGQISALTQEIETASETEHRIEEKLDTLTQVISVGLNGLTQVLLNLQNVLGDPPSE